jgi:hypothetical protein
MIWAWADAAKPAKRQTEIGVNKYFLAIFMVWLKINIDNELKHESMAFRSTIRKLMPLNADHAQAPVPKDRLLPAAVGGALVT